MRRYRTLISLLTLALISGCAFAPRPARTSVTPGESEIRSEREERRPSESTVRIKATVPPAQPSNPPVVVKIILPPAGREE